MESAWTAIGIAVGAFALVLFLFVAVAAAYQANQRKRDNSDEGFAGADVGDFGTSAVDFEGSEGGGSWWDAISSWFSGGDTGGADGGDGDGGDGGD